MTNPRRPDDARLSTADLAAAGERASERPTERPVDRAADRQVDRPADRQVDRPVDPNMVQRSGQPVANPGRPMTNREVAAQNAQNAQNAQRMEHPQHGHVIADATANRQTPEHEHSTPLFARNESDDFRHRWGDIQTGFVDEPRQAVERADALVAAAIKRLAEVFAQERATLEQQWSRGGDVSTEDLRVALRRYRGFFDRLLSV